MTEINLESIIEALKSICSEEDLRPYKDFRQWFI